MKVTATATDADYSCGDDGSEDDGQEVKIAVDHNAQMRRKWDKINICKFCLEPQSKIAPFTEKTH